MGELREQRPVLLLAAVSSKFDDAFEWARQEMCVEFGELKFQSPLFDFNETRYYQKSMGAGLRKQLLAFEVLIDPAELPAIKIRTNQLEVEFSETGDFDVERPINIDPGYLTEAKLILATTKDRDHRIYLRQGIFAEVTLYYLLKSGWQHSRWTYPDYQRDDFKAFFSQCRDWLRKQYKA